MEAFAGAEMGKYDQWKNENPNQAAGATFEDWVKGGSPTQIGSTLGVKPQSQLTGLPADNPDVMAANAAGGSGQYNLQKFQEDFIKPQLGADYAGGFNPRESATAKKSREDLALSDRGMRGRASTYFSKKDEANPNIFRRSLLGG
jgi:hypothetical protein